MDAGRDSRLGEARLRCGGKGKDIKVVGQRRCVAAQKKKKGECGQAGVVEVL